MESSPARACLVCGEAEFRYGNRRDRRPVAVPDGRVHFRCLGAWLVEQALEQWFPHASRRELEVVRRRLRLDEVLPEKLPTLAEVGREMGWTTSARASQVQADAMARFERAVERALVVLRGPQRRELSFVALGEGRPGFRAAEAESVLEREFGA